VGRKGVAGLGCGAGAEAAGCCGAATTLVGRYLGEERPEEAEIAGRRCLILTFGYSLVCAAAFVFLREPLVRVFTPVDEVVALAAPVLLLAAVFQVFDGIHMVVYGALRGAGDTRYPMWAVVFSSWCLGVPLVWLLAIRLDHGVVGAWLGMTGMLVVQSALMLRRFQSGAWKAMRVVPTVPAPPLAEDRLPTGPLIPPPADR